MASRALKRRVELKLDRQEIALRIGIPTGGLKNWEQMLPQKRKVEFEKRWEEVLGVPEGWLRVLEMEAPPVSSNMLLQKVSANAATVAGEIRAAASWLSQARFAKRTCDYAALSPEEKRLADMFALRYGVSGEDNTTLQVIGDTYGLTRERIRQVVEKMAERAVRLALDTPCIDRLAEEIRSHVPATAKTLDVQFRYLLGESLSIESVDRFCREILGRRIMVLTDRPANMALDWSPTVVDPDNHDAERLRVVRDVVLRMVRQCGAAQIQFVTGAASEELNRGLLPADVTRDCRTIPGFEWLVEEDGWFWVGYGKENRLLTATTKILATAGCRVDVEEIHSGFVRSRRGYVDPDRQRPYSIEPPMQVVVEVLRRVAGIKNIQFNDFYLDPPIAAKDVLSDAENEAYQLITANGNIVSRHQLNTTLVDGGKVKFMAMQMSLDYSPIYRRLDKGVYSLRGVPLAAASLQEAQASVGGTGKTLMASACDADGYFHLECVLTDGMVKNRYWSLPSSYGRLLSDGEYRLEGFDDPVVFSSDYGNNRVKRFLSKLLSLGLNAGDRFRFSVNPEIRLMRVAPMR